MNNNMKQRKTNTCGWLTTRRLMVAMLLCFLATPPPCQAQTGLHINQLFEGRIVPAKKMVETRIRGKAISRYKLTFFHSVRFTCDDETFKKIDRLASQDYAEGTSTQAKTPLQESALMNIKGNKHTFTQMYELPPKGALTRFLCYKRQNDVVTVIYLEGSLTSLSELKTILND